MTYDVNDLERMALSLSIKAGYQTAVDNLGYDYELDCITLEDVTVFTIAGAEAESYKKLMIPKTTPLVNGEWMKGNLLEMSQAYEKEGWFVPSMGLASSIIDKLIKTGGKLGNYPKWHYQDNEICNLLASNLFPFNPLSLRITNTFIDYESSKIIHYPCMHEIHTAMTGDKKAILENHLTFSKRRECSFNRDELSDFIYGTGDFDENQKFLIDMTGAISNSQSVMTAYYGKRVFETQFPNPILNGTMEPQSYVAGYGISGDRMVLSTYQMVNHQTRIPLVKVIEE